MTELSNSAFPTMLYPPAGTTLTESLIKAYLVTAYRVLHSDTFEGCTLEVRKEHPAARLLMCRLGGTSAAFITAWNPIGNALSAAKNGQRNKALREELTLRSLNFFAGVGEDAGGDWPGEESIFVIGLDLEAAEKLAVAYQNNALVCVGADAVPQLVLLR